MRIYLSPESIERKSGIVLPPDKARHVVSVMRCREGDELTIIDGSGSSYPATISSIQKNSVLTSIVGGAEVEAEPATDVILCQGMLKGDKMDQVIQKATELGVSAVIPLISARSQVRETRKTARWQKIAEEACEQCGRAFLPEVLMPAQFVDFITNTAVESGIIFWEKGGLSVDAALETTGLLAANTDRRKHTLYVLVGPEGGFDLSEVESAESHGFIKATLGKRTLRADTAAVSALALVQFLLEKEQNVR